MKRKLTKQILHEWRSNLWLVVELIIISVVLWYIGDHLTVVTDIRTSPLGLDTEHTFLVSTSYSWEGSASYVKPQRAGDTDSVATPQELYLADQDQLMNRLRELPGVVAVAMSTGSPFTYNYNGYPMMMDDNPTDDFEKCARPNTWHVTSGFPLVFNLRGIGGETPEQLAEMLRDGRLLVSERFRDEVGFDGTFRELVNKKTRTYGSGQTYTIGAVVPDQRRNEYEPAGLPYAFVVSDYSRSGNMFLRAATDNDDEFIAAFRRDLAKMRGGNMYVTDITSLRQIRDDLHRTDDADVRDMYVCMGFLMLTVFLGLLGTFWFRTQQRVKEIAVRKVSGATNGGIFMRQISEGLILLCAATLPALAIDYVLEANSLASSADYRPDGWVAWWLLGGLGVFVTMALMIVAGIWFPARKAMKVEPAEILRGE